jgi:hypothetical protein
LFAPSIARPCGLLNAALLPLPLVFPAAPVAEPAKVVSVTVEPLMTILRMTLFCASATYSTESRN